MTSPVLGKLIWYGSEGRCTLNRGKPPQRKTIGRVRRFDSRRAFGGIKQHGGGTISARK
jgi:hypothetical protein